MKNRTLQELNEQIKKDNEVFLASSNAEKRVAIAQDCLARIAFQQFKPHTGSICKFTFNNSTKKDGLKNLLDKGESCHVCAKGGLLVAYVGRVNELKVKDLSGHYYDNPVDDFNSLDTNEHRKLLEIFDGHQLALIETVFEDNQYLTIDENNNEINLDMDAIEEYRTKILLDWSTGIIDLKFETFLLNDICENIIANKGTFVLN